MCLLCCASDCNGEASLGECASDDRVSEAQCNLQLDGVMRHMEANWLNSASVSGRVRAESRSN